MSSPAVLLVEDEPLIRLTIGEALNDEGLEVLEAATPDEAIKLLLEGKEVSVLLTDVKMPGPMDGVDLANYVAACWPNIQIIIMSGHAYADDARIPDGVTFVAKPFSIMKLANDIRVRTA